MRGEAKLLCFCPFDRHMEIRLIEWLLHAEVNGAGDRADLFEDLVCPGTISLEIMADHLDVDRSGQSEVQNLRDHGGGQERKCHPGEVFRQTQAELLDVFFGRIVLRRQCHHNVCIRSPDWRRIAVREINAAVRQANIVDDAVHFGRRDFLPDRILDEITQKSRILDTHTGWPAHVKLEAAGINGRKEILTEPRNNRGKRSEAGCKESKQKGTAAVKATLQHTTVCIAKAFKC